MRVTTRFMATLSLMNALLLVSTATIGMLLWAHGQASAGIVATARLTGQTTGAALAAVPRCTAYVAAKHGVLGLVRSFYKLFELVKPIGFVLQAAEFAAGSSAVVLMSVVALQLGEGGGVTAAKGGQDGVSGHQGRLLC